MLLQPLIGYFSWCVSGVSVVVRITPSWPPKNYLTLSTICTTKYLSPNIFQFFPTLESFSNNLPKLSFIACIGEKNEQGENQWIELCWRKELERREGEYQEDNKGNFNKKIGKKIRKLIFYFICSFFSPSYCNAAQTWCQTAEN